MSTKIAVNSKNYNNHLFELQIGTVLGHFHGLLFKFLWEIPARLLIREGGRGRRPSWSGYARAWGSPRKKI